MPSLIPLYQCLSVAAMLSFLPHAVLSYPSESAFAACNAINATGGIETQVIPEALAEYDYLQAKSHYWSAANADLYPACVVFPESAQGVSDIISVLLNYTDVKFAVKSGGHNPNVGFSNVDGGVLISLSKLASTTLSDDKETADVEPGSRWNEALAALIPHGKAIVGGRLGDVGVGGYILGGGLSFLSTQYGMACDDVVNFEVVLADASIVNANATSNTDLFWSLKGGGNQFGIVTKFTMKTHDMGDVWGGLRTYIGSYSSAILNATHDFNTNYNDPKAAIIVTAEIGIDSLLETFFIFYFYDGPTPPPGIFDKFDAIPTITSNLTTQSYTDLLNANDVGNFYGLRILIRGITLPNLPSTNGTDLYNYHYDTWKSYILSKAPTHPGFIFTMAFQPFPYLIPAISASNPSGNNALSQLPSYGDRMFIEYDTLWETSLGDADAQTFAANITSGIEEYAQKTYAGVKNTRFTEGNLEEVKYNPIFMNDATKDQMPLQSYGEQAYERLKGIQKNVDPDGVWATRTDGFKFT